VHTIRERVKGEKALVVVVLSRVVMLMMHCLVEILL